MSDPIYEIPVLSPGSNVEGWTPGIRRRGRADAASAVPTVDATASEAQATERYDSAPTTSYTIDDTSTPTPSGSRTPGSSAADIGQPDYSAAEFSTADYSAAEPVSRRARFTEPALAETPDALTEILALADATPVETVAPIDYSTVDFPVADFPVAESAGEPYYSDAQSFTSRYFSPPEAEHVALRDVSLSEALHTVVSLNASDLHVTADAPPMIRVSGGLVAIEGARPWSRETINAELRAIANERQLAMFEENLELDFAHPLTEESRFRVNYYMQRGAIGAAFRLIPTEIKRLVDLGVPESVSRFAALPRGLVLVTGPTGSGKSTTLAGLIDLVNRTRADHIVTVEDPIEFMHKNQKSIINQREVGADTHSFANALKHVLRQDPDVILIGELRDLETISVALTAAETGHLVFATLHTQDAAQTIDRVIDVFPSHQQDQVRTQLAGTLQGVVSQTLVPKASGSGRVVATEVMVITPALSNLIREGKTYQILSAMQAGRELGMHTMDQHLAELVNSGRVTRQAAEAKAHDPEGFRRLINGVQSPTEQAARALQASGIDFGDSFSVKAER